MKPSMTTDYYKALVSIPAWQQNLLNDAADFTNSIDSVHAAYSKVPMIYRAVKMRCDALSSVGVKISTLAGDEAEWPYKCDLRDLIWKTEAALLGNGRAVILKLKNRVKILDLQWLNPFSIVVTHDNLRGLIFSQAGQSWPEEDIIYIKEFSYNDDLTTGASTVMACLNDAALMNYQTRFASRFFEFGGMPIMLVSSEGKNIDKDEQDRMQSFFNKLASGVSNAWRALVTRSKLTPEVVSQDLDKMTMPELYAQATKNIANAFGIPVNMFSGDDNYASADSHRMQFWQDTVRPRGRIIEAAFNRQLFAPLGLQMEFLFDELDIFQEDEEKRAGAFKMYVEAGLNPAAVVEMLGIETSSDIPLIVEEPKAEPEDEAPANALDAEMGKWQKKAIKRVKEGKCADCSFESEIIPAGMIDEIHAALKLCYTADEVSAVFEGRREPGEIGDILSELKRANDLLEREPVTVNIINKAENEPAG